MPPFIEDKNIGKLYCAEIEKVCPDCTVERDYGFSVLGMLF